MARKSILAALRTSQQPEPEVLEQSNALAASEATPADSGPQAALTGAALGGPDHAEHETAQATQQAEQALQAEGVVVKPLQTERKPRTKAQLIRAARRQREFGRKLLQRRTGGFASVTVKVKLNNAVLAAAFERFFTVIENCAYLVARHGAAVLGDAAAEKILARLDEMCAEVLADRKRELSAAQALAGESAVQFGERFVTPQFTRPAFEAEVQLRTPQARRVLELFETSDAILTEAETLYWNGVRTLSEKNDEALRAKRTVFPLFTFSAQTVRSLHRRMREMNAPSAAVAADLSAAGEAPAEGSAAQAAVEQASAVAA